MARLSDLPSEIYAVILSHVPPSDRQKAVLNLIRALPRSPIPRNQIFDHIIVHSQAAALYLYHLFRKRKTDEGAQYNPSEQVASIAVRVWSIDADIIVNLLVLLPSVPVMQLFIGTTYSPEHLYDLFTKPRLKLRDLRLRFKPYVEKATYLPFLQGAYFDQTLVQIAKWPVTEESHLENMSITQDTISYKAHVKFAQPIASPIRSYAEVQTNQYFQVFFSFKPLTDLSLSPVGQHLRALRISVPAKPVTPHLASHDTSFPKLDFLDISTTALPPPSAEKAIVSLLERLIRLRHVVVDRNAGTMPRDSPGWTSLGRACALAGVGKAKRKEKDIQEWTDARRREEEAVQAALNGEAPVAPALAPAPPAARVRRGRRGLATATISLRERQSQARTTNDAPVGSSSTTSNRDDATARRVRVIPSPPTLRTFSTAFAGPSNPTTQQRADWGKAFEDGFMDGCRTLNAIWKRMQDSATVRVMRFTDADPNPNAFKHDDDEGPAIFRDVADIAIAGHWIGWEPTRPIICFGTERAVAKPAVDALSGSLGQMGIGTPGAFDGERAAYPAGTAMSADQGTMTSKALARGTSVSDTGPSSVGGLWEVEEFIEWGPGHTDGCGHNIGRQIFE